MTPAKRKRKVPADRTEEFSAAAEEAGLRYVTDQEPGIGRVATQEGFAYVGANGHRITNEQKLRRIRSLAIPPAWTDVWICPLATGHLQVTGRDARGRKQYRYHPRYRAIRDETKFDRMLQFSRVLPRIRRRVEDDIRRPHLPRAKVLATVVVLLEKTLIRVGNPEYARENESYGLTTLRRDHVQVEGSQLRFEFRGKSGILHRVDVTDRRLARIIQRCQTLPGEELFQYHDDQDRIQVVDSGDINAYLREISGRDVTAKDFRTWAGTMQAAMVLRDMGPARNKKEARANIIRAVDQVAERLGNTRAVCRKYYVHPRVFDEYLRGRVVPDIPRGGKRGRQTHELRRQERAVLKFLALEA